MTGRINANGEKRLKVCSRCKYCALHREGGFECQLDRRTGIFGDSGRIYINPHGQKAMCLLWNHRFRRLHPSQEDIKWLIRNMIIHKKGEEGEMDITKLLGVYIEDDHSWSWRDD